MSDDQWLRDALEASVPDAPSTDRLDGVRERRRRATRRRNVLVGAGAALAIAAVGATALVQAGDGPSDDAIAHETRDPVYDGPACPPADAPPSGPSTIPDDPVSVRLCRGAGTPIDPPRDAVVTGADQVAALIDDLPTLPAYPACNLDLGPGYLLLFAYADGSTASASGELGGCRQVTVGSIAHQGAAKPLDAFVGLLRSQRATSTPGPQVAVPTCGDEDDPLFGAGSMVADPTEMVRAVFCLRDGSGTQVAVDAADLATILADRPRRGPDLDVYDCTMTSGWRIVGVTAWGDRTGIRGDCDHYIGFGGRARTIGSDVQQILTRLRQEATAR